MRLFLAYELPNELQQQIYSVFSDLHQRLRNFSWIKPGRLHLTLRFLGEIEESYLNEHLLALLQQEFAAQKDFELQFQSLGIFPNLSRPRVLWLGVKGDYLHLHRQAVSLEKKLSDQSNQQITQQYHKKFSPHITLAKMREVKKLQGLSELLHEYEKIDLGKFTFRAPALFESVLTEKGSEYKILKQF